MNILAFWKRRLAEKRAARRANTQSKKIDRRLQEETKQSKQRPHDVLLIGTPGSEAEGFAIVKRMKLVHDDYTTEQLAGGRSAIWKILLENSRTIVDALRDIDPKCLHSSTKANCEYIMNHRRDTDSLEFLFLPRFAQVVQDLWSDEIIPLLLDRPCTLHLPDNAEYFFAEAQRITADDYVPSTEDIGHTSENGVTETRFDIGQLSIRLLQVYGQQGYFKKWIHQFDGVTCLMFCASLADYDEPGISRRNRRTRLAESLAHFEAVVNWSRFRSRQTPILLFLTGMEDFKAKLQHVPLSEYFPEYTGGTDADQGVSCIRAQFLERNRLSLPIYPFVNEVANPGGMRILGTTVADIVMSNYLRAACSFLR